MFTIVATVLSFDDYGDGIGDGWRVLRDHANRNQPDARVPTCPGWTICDLVAHQGTVHRWAAASIRSAALGAVDTAAIEAEGQAVRDQLGWLDLGAKDLLQALVDAPEDLEGRFFLEDAPPLRMAWARRQCHETTVHAVDAMSATFGCAPLSSDTWIRPRLATDGIDELVTGFLPRSHQRMRTSAPTSVLIEATDTGAQWTLRLSQEPVVTVREALPHPDATLRGTAAALYLGLWNRGDEIETDGVDVLSRWRESFRVTWS